MEKNDWIDVETDDWEDQPLGDGGKGQAGLEHFGNAAALGYLPQLQAAAEPGMTKVMDFISKRNISKDLPGYTKRRDENIFRMENQEKEFPAESIGGTLGGTVSSSIGLG